jgi:excinuclease ABC subunit A
LDEPTTGLHFEDIIKLLGVLDSLVNAGNSVVVIEHNLDVIKCADWVIDMGPEAGKDGGQLVFAGTPEQLVHYASNRDYETLASQPMLVAESQKRTRKIAIASKGSLPVSASTANSLRSYTGEALKEVL